MLHGDCVGILEEGETEGCQLESARFRRDYFVTRAPMAVTNKRHAQLAMFQRCGKRRQRPAWRCSVQ